jgi:hypothetical protein
MSHPICTAEVVTNDSHKPEANFVNVLFFHDERHKRHCPTTRWTTLYCQLTGCITCFAPLEAVSAICDPKSHHNVVTMDSLHVILSIYLHL